MLSEPMTLYKLMNLYMLKQVNFPLTNAQLSSFFLDREYTTYFTLQQALNELLEAGLVRKETLHNSSRYEITRERKSHRPLLKILINILKKINSGFGMR